MPSTMQCFNNSLSATGSRGPEERLRDYQCSHFCGIEQETQSNKVSQKTD